MGGQATGYATARQIVMDSLREGGFPHLAVERLIEVCAPQPSQMDIVP